MNSETLGLAEVIAALVRANEKITTVADDPVLLNEVLAEVAQLERQRNELVHGTRVPARRTYETSVPLRDQVVQTLRLSGRPTSVRLLADLARARFEYVIAPPKLSSLRRDEASSWQQAHSGSGRTLLRDVYVVPALTFDRFAPVRGTLALSSWPAEQRLIAPASPRVDMLRITAALATECAEAPTGAAWLDGVQRLLWRLARTVPGVKPAGELDLAQVQRAVAAELTVIEEGDAVERRESAARAEGVLDAFSSLFGATTTVHTGMNLRGAS